MSTLHVNGSSPEPRLGVFFETQRWDIAVYRDGLPFSIHGWTPQPIPASAPC